MSQASDYSYGQRVSIHLFERVNEANTFLWREEWENNESLMQYCKENRFRATMGAISILGELIHHKHIVFEEEQVDG
jgi:quinol monooxygenase YgiN